MRVSRDFGDFLKREVFRLGAGGEFLEAEINGVCPEMKRGEAGIWTAGGGQKFNPTIVRLADSRRRRERGCQSSGAVIALRKLGFRRLGGGRQLRCRTQSSPLRQFG